MRKSRNLLGGLLVVALFAVAQPGWAQRPRPNFSPPTTTFQNPGVQPAPALTAPPSSGGLTPVAPPAATTPGFASPGARLQPPTFDPFATQPEAAATTPSLSGQAYLGGDAYGGYGTPGSQPYYDPAYPGIPQQPTAQFPGGMFGPQGVIGQPQPGPYLKFLDDLRFRYTWLRGEGGGGDELDINDFETAVSLVWPNFLHSGQPLRISPGFIFHLWNGPSPPFSPPADLPSRAYSAYVEADWITDTSRRFGGEVDFIAGIYSDFSSVTTNSLRWQGTGLGWFRITPRLTLKFGVVYLDRLDLKLLPAGGLFWQPNPDVNFEIYFPRPKLSQRLTTWGNTDIWLYVAAEYGGGSWTIQRTFGPGFGTADQVDINDIRVYGGLEWFSGIGKTKGFVEGGYVFHRELVYRSGVPALLELDDTFMIRAGFAF